MSFALLAKSQAPEYFGLYLCYAQLIEAVILV